MMRKYIIPIFIPELACPNQCIYCNQKNISGQLYIPSVKEIIEKIETYLSTFKSPYSAEVAFFGGNFTGIGSNIQEELLKTVYPYIKDDKLSSIRLSTRPDYINERNLDMLLKYKVKTIELGSQSLSQDVLDFAERGHNVRDVINASRLVNSYGFELGLQMMIGLPKDTIEKSIETANMIVSLGAKNTRIYPTLVIENTKLAELYKNGEYRALTLNDAVDWTSKIYNIFYNNGLEILRVGLHPSEGLINKTDYLAGPFHVSFRELVLTKIWRDKFSSIIHKQENSIKIYVSSKNINYAVGYYSQNKKELLKIYNEVLFIADDTLSDFEFVYEN